MYRYYSIIDIILCLTLVSMVFLVYENSRLERSIKQKFYLTYICIAVAMASEWTGILLNGAPNSTITIHKFIKAVDYIATPAAGVMIVSYLSKRDKIQTCMNLIMVVNAVLQSISVFTGWTFFIDSSNVYHHGPGYVVYIIIYMLTFLGVLVEFYLYGKQYRRQNRSSLFSIIVVVIAGILIQELFDYRISYLSLTLAALLLYIHYSEFSQLASDANLQMQKKLLETDTLTGLFSRYAYTNAIKELQENTKLAENLVVFSVDVNELKSINDTYGHLAGDEIIKGAASCILTTFERYGTCYRTGGDEFIAFLQIDQLHAYELKLLLQYEAEKWRGQLVDHLSLSIGYAIAAEYTDISIEKLIGLADEKMYEAKAQFYMQSGKRQRKNDVRENDAIDARQKEYIDIISALASEITGLYVIDRKKRLVTAYRLSASDHRVRSGVPLKQGFEAAMNQFIEKNVHPDDQKKMRQSIQVYFMEQELYTRESFTVHFRSVQKGQIHFYYMKCLRNDSEGEFDKIIVSFCPEDHFVRIKEMADSIHEIGLDELTGIYTKQAFLYHAKTVIERENDENYSIIISDILNFKMFNSVYGEKRGDELLKHIADYLKNNTEDTIYARYGADQFVVLLQTADQQSIRSFIAKMQAYMSQSVAENVILKFGICEKMDNTELISRYCDRALLALKSIKNKYDHDFAFFEGIVSQMFLKEQTYENRFMQAISKREFTVWYQPKYNIYTGKIVGAEALVRWKNADGTMIHPSEFIPVFERDGLISQLDDYVFRSVCEYQKRRIEKGKRLIPISINLSRNSMHQKDIAKRYRMIADECRVSPGLLPIEIMESTATSTREIRPLANTFYEAGFPLHMDDFGSEQSSLAGLNILHFDVVKLDKSLIDYIGDEHGNLVLMYTIALAKELGLHIIAEGVENEAQVNYLRANGCETVQGFYFSKPMPEEDFAKIIAENLEDEDSGFDYRNNLTAYDNVVRRAMKRMFQRMPGGFFTYLADEDERIIASNRYLWNLFGCETETEFMDYVGGSFKGIVCPEDLERVELYIREQIQENENDMDFVQYDIIRKDGRRVHVLDYGHLDRQPGGDIFYVFISEAAHM